MKKIILLIGFAAQLVRASLQHKEPVAGKRKFKRIIALEHSFVVKKENY